ncbi:V-type proton ATPase subunit e2-like isoform X4 [Actinidia eriantha]|uniref:V-type proton ATPase subunit e2-like isoform X4 n=1 Tax=Actinidia eriantha TaxID=165200 RepID=UPI00258F8D93|nr:V-type proton ATPase subunit e2-like isoform X4 [Actinidia eriantha]
MKFDCFSIGDIKANIGFLVASLIFVVTGIIASLCTRICFNRGTSTNLLHLTLVITATVCCWMMYEVLNKQQKFYRDKSLSRCAHT